jgi:hypothetical protein
MDMTWITERIAVGGGIWTDDKMQQVVREGVTHIIDMQIEFDDTEIAKPYGISVLWNPVDDDFQPKPPSVFQRGVEFALAALNHDSRDTRDDNSADGPPTKLFIHCAAGVHRAPMMTLAVLRALGWSKPEAMRLITSQRYVADLAPVYVDSVERFMQSYAATK